MNHDPDADEYSTTTKFEFSNFRRTKILKNFNWPRAPSTKSLSLSVSDSAQELLSCHDMDLSLS